MSIHSTYKGVTIYRNQPASKLTGTRWKYGAGLNLYANTLAGIRALITKQVETL